MEKEKTSLVIDKPLFRKLRICCLILGLKIKDVTREMIEEWLKENEEKVKEKQKELL